MAGEEEAPVRSPIARDHVVDELELPGLVVVRVVEVAADDEQVAGGRQLGVPRPGLDEGRHALDGVEPPEADREGQVAPLGREGAEQLVEVAERGAGVRAARPLTVDLLTDPFDRRDVDAFLDDRDSLGRSELGGSGGLTRLRRVRAAHGTGAGAVHGTSEPPIVDDPDGGQLEAEQFLGIPLDVGAG